MKYPHSESLKKNRDFQLLYKEGKSRANRYLVLYVKENGMEKNRFGVSVSKKVGNSVVRHRITRLIRESYRLHEDMFNSGLDMAVIARVSAKGKAWMKSAARCFTWESFRESSKNENCIDQIDSILSKISIAVETYEMSLFSQLFSVWSGSHPEVRSPERRSSGCLENSKVQSVFQWWI